MTKHLTSQALQSGLQSGISMATELKGLLNPFYESEKKIIKQIDKFVKRSKKLGICLSDSNLLEKNPESTESL